MPRYFIDTQSDRSSIRDQEGVELETPEIARQQLIKTLPGILLEEMSVSADRCEISVDIRDASGRVLFTASLNYAGRWTG